MLVTYEAQAVMIQNKGILKIEKFMHVKQIGWVEVALI